jgi:hypothetical protein
MKKKNEFDGGRHFCILMSWWRFIFRPGPGKAVFVVWQCSSVAVWWW